MILIWYYNYYIDSCTINSLFKNIIQECDSDSPILNKDSNNYSYSWNNFNVYSSNDETLSTNSFQFTSSDSLNSYPYFGIYNTYSLDGYVYEINHNNLTKIQFDLQNLYKFNWINGQTRAIFISFVTFNVNINLFAYVTILFEILPTGNIINSIQINTINLYQNNANNLSILFIVYFILITITLIKEIPIMIQKKFEYIKQFWNLIEIIIIILSIVSFVLSFNCSNKQTIINRRTNRYSIMKFRQLNDKIQILIIILSFNCLLSTIKLIRILKFNIKIFIFSKMLKSCFNNLFNCCFIFIIFMFAFIQLMYLLFNENDVNNDFKSFTSSIMTVFNMLITRTPISYLNNSLIILPFFLILDFILLTLMIIVLEDTYKSFKINNTIINNKSVSLSFDNFIHLFKPMFKLLSPQNNKENDKQIIKYIEKDILKDFTISSNKLISSISKVYML